MSININSEASCRKAYLNYHCYGNTMKISTQEMAEITTRWESQIKSWQATVSKDENEYEFDDSDYANYKENGKQKAQDATGYENSGSDKEKQRGRTAGDTVFAAGSATFGVMSAIKSGINIGKNLAGIRNFGKGGQSLLKEGTKGASKESVKATAKTGAKTCAILGASLAIATAAMYRIMKPNKEQKEVCDELQNVMAENKATLTETQADMENSANELMELSDEAAEANEDANKNIEEEKTEFDMYKASYETLKAKAESGQPLREDEKALYEKLCQYMTENGENITEAQEKASSVVSDIYDDMESYQECYDSAAESMGEVEGSTDYAADIDETTKAQCITEAVSQGANAIGGAVSGAQLLGSGPWFWALGVASIAAGTSSGVAAFEQGKMAKDVGDEIDIRTETQDFNTETMDMYTEEVDTYDGYMQGVEDLEIEMPDDLEIPEETPLPVTANDGYPNGTPDTIKPDEDDKNPKK